MKAGQGPDGGIDLASTRIGLLLGVGFLLAVIINLAKAAAEAGIPAIALAFWMQAGAGLVLLAVAVAAGQAPRLGVRHLAFYLGLGAVSFAFPNALGFAVAGRVGPAYGSIVYALSPLLTYALALASGMERLAWRRLLGLALGFAGTAVVVADRLGAGGETTWTLLALLIPLALAAGNVLRSRLWPEGATPLSVAPAMLLAASACLLPLVTMAGLPLPLGPQGRLLLAQIGVATLFYLLFFRLQRAAGPVYLSQIGYVATGFGVTIAALVFADPVSVAMLAGIGLIVLGVVLVSWSGAVEAGAAPARPAT